MSTNGIYILSILCSVSLEMVVWISTVICLLLLTVTLSSQQAPGDEDGECSGGPYPNNVKTLMDSYNYEQLLRGSGTGNPPVEGAVWTDRSVDGNDITGTVISTYVSVQFGYRHQV